VAKKKKKKPNTPRVKRMNRKSRLQSAVSWLPTYNGKSLIRGYRKHFGVDVGSAIAELGLLGVQLSAETIQQAKTSAEASVKDKKARKEKRRRRLEEEQLSYPPDSDETYAYIAGYTSGGVPFGITWEEMERFNDQDSLDETIPPLMEMDEIDAVVDLDYPCIEARDAEEVPFDLDIFLLHA